MRHWPALEAPPWRPAWRRVPGARLEAPSWLAPWRPALREPAPRPVLEAACRPVLQAAWRPVLQARLTTRPASPT